MGVCEETPKITGMHWQQHERYNVGPAYDPSRDLSPNLPVHSSDSSSMGEGDGGTNSSSGGSTTSTSSSNSSSTGSTTSACSHSATSIDCSNNNTTATCGIGGNNSHNNNPIHGTSTCCRVVQQATCTAVTPGSAVIGSATNYIDYSKLQNSPAHHQHHHHTGTTTCKLEESIGGTNNQINLSSVMCAGCGNRIQDRFYLLAVDRRWHASCLQCCQCRQTLDGEGTCFFKDGNIYCKKDYYRLFGMRRCGRCQAAILSSELVMRARDLVFHVHCFTCSVCNSALTKGDHFGMHGPNVLCQHHYEIAVTSSGISRSSPPCTTPTCQSAIPAGYHNPYHTPPFPSPNDYHHTIPPTNPNTMPPQPPPNASPCGVGSGLDPTSNKVYFNGAPAARQKGRPRKRKPKDLESMTANLDLNSDSYLDVSYGRGAGPSPGMPGSNGQSQRTKRMRTSFKHHQLRTMKSYFAINHNPDAKDLKQLSQKTGLPKRVLQVWFQNARAKWRRMVIKQEGKIPSEKGVGSPSDLQHMHHGSQPGDYHGGMHLQGPDASCSPHYMMSSPPSLECS